LSHAKTNVGRFINGKERKTEMEAVTSSETNGAPPAEVVAEAPPDIREFEIPRS
jgi:hypothetical protein